MVFSTLLVYGLSVASTNAQNFPEVIYLDSLDGSTGFQIDGENLGDSSGISVSGAGDVNGDNVDDLIIGASFFNVGGVAEVGRAYIVYGNTNGFPPNLDLANLQSDIGFAIDGENWSDHAANSVDGAGDFNGDGFDDLIIGAKDADPNGDRSGRSYVLFGGQAEHLLPQPLADLDGSNGFQLDGEASLHGFGISVASAGDINGDGFDDVIIGAKGADPNGDDSGRSYVVFGGSGGFASPFQLSDLDGANGFAINGEASYNDFGHSVSRAGDINNDGFDDLIIGAPRASEDFTFNGRAYIVFGMAGGFGAEISVGGLDGTNGFRLDGAAGNHAGDSVAGAGDFNGDGIDDIIIGAPGADPNGSDSGSTYVVFGRNGGFPSRIILAGLDGANGLRIDGESSFGKSGAAASLNGDVNGDGIDDLIIGAPGAKFSGSSRTGGAYVVFGSSNGFPAPLQLADLDGTNGFKLAGEVDNDDAGKSVQLVGDINGDGIDDLIIGASGHDANGVIESGRTYVVFGQGTPPPDDGGDVAERIVFKDDFEF